jgi:adenosylcobinamide-GDP ribazoletransferase
VRAAADILTALRLLTIVPLGHTEGTRPVRFFTWIGWVFAVVALGVASAAVWVDRAQGLYALLTAVMIVTAWGLLSGLLHWDGLADSVDALGVRGDATRRLAVMRESGVGAFGVTAVVFVALTQVTSVAAIVESGTWWALGAAPVLGRLAAAVALAGRIPARPDGLAARYGGRESLPRLLLLTLPLVPLVVFPASPWRLALVVAAVIVGAAVPGLFTRRLGGITGDVVGATVLLTETFVLLVAAVLGGLL